MCTLQKLCYNAINITYVFVLVYGNKKILYIFAYTHATFLVVEIADRFLGQALYG